MSTPDRPVFTGEYDAKPLSLDDVGHDAVTQGAGLHRHRTQSGQAYTHGHASFTTPHLHERDLDVHDPR